MGHKESGDQCCGVVLVSLRFFLIRSEPSETQKNSLSHTQHLLKREVSQLLQMYQSCKHSKGMRGTAEGWTFPRVRPHPSPGNKVQLFT